MDEVVQFLCNKRRALEACKLLLFSLKNNENIDIDLCNIVVILDLCKLNKASEAFSLCYELVDKGLHQDLICLNLVAALETEGRTEEAAFISKRIPRPDHLDRSERNNSTTKSRTNKCKSHSLFFTLLL
jgi:hypothetical protein